MPLILAVEPDRRQASQLKKLVRSGVGAELVLADTTERALDAIGNRIPDLVLIPALLSPQDDEALATALRVIAAAAHVQTLTIPVFAASTASVSKKGGMLAKLGLGRSRSASLEGCDPDVFAEQIAAYLADAAATRALAEEDEVAQPAPSAVVSLETTPEPVDVFEEEWQTVALAEQDDVETVDAPQAVFAVDSREAAFAPQVDAFPVHDPDALLVEANGLDLGAFVAELEQVQLESVAAMAPVFEMPPVVEMPVVEMPVVEMPVVEMPVAAMPPAEAIEPEPLQEESEPEPDSVAESELWIASALSPKPAWPRLEAPSRPPALAAAPPPPVIEHVQETVATLEPAAPRVVVKQAPAALPAVAKPDVPAAPVPHSTRPEWTAMLEALRHDIDRLRSERTDATTGAGRSTPVAAAAPRPAAAPPIRRAEHAAKPVDEAHPAPAVPRQKKKHKKEQGQVQDEWGFFDPEQCGFTALLAKLDEISTSNDETQKRP